MGFGAKLHISINVSREEAVLFKRICPDVQEIAAKSSKARNLETNATDWRRRQV